MNAAVDLRDRDDRRLLDETVRRSVSEAMREYALLEGPAGCIHELAPPTAIPHERRLLGALLGGAIRLDELVPVSARDFYTPLHQAIAIAVEVLGTCEKELTILSIGKALMAQGVVGRPEYVVDELERLIEDAPAVFDVNEAKREILDAAERRRLIRILQDATADLRLGRRTAGQVLSDLRETSVG